MPLAPTITFSTPAVPAGRPATAAIPLPAKRLLFVGAGCPWKGGAGYLVRQNLFLRSLACVADELHVATFDPGPDPRPPAYARTFTPLPMPLGRARGRVAALAADLLSPLPRMLRRDAAEPRRRVAALNPASFDAVFAFRIEFAHHAGLIGHPRLILDVDDPEHLRVERRLASTVDHVDRRTRADLAKLRQFEHRAVAAAALSFVCQENDRQAGWPKLPEVVPNGVDVPPTPPPRKPTDPVVLLVGNFAGGSDSPNVDGLHYFLADVWPRILDRVPAAEFHLVGATGTAAQAAAAAAPRTVVRGFVDDLSAAYAAAAVAVAPIRFGTGTRVKILEAFAHGCPVVSTLPGAEGIAAVPGREIELAATTGDFADAVATLLEQPATAARIGQAGHALARRSYDQAVIRADLIDRLAAFFKAATAAGRKGPG